MGTYEWSCFSCGTANSSEAQWCKRCDCPARATVGEMTRFRAQLESRGASISPAAPPRETDLAVVRGRWSHSLRILPAFVVGAVASMIAGVIGYAVAGIFGMFIGFVGGDVLALWLFRNLDSE
jgi:hypothetical protein